MQIGGRSASPIAEVEPIYLPRKERISASGGERGGKRGGPACEERKIERDAAASRFDPLSIALLSHYIETWISRGETAGPFVLSPSLSFLPRVPRRYSALGNTRKNRAGGNPRKVRPRSASLCRGRSMQIRHEISLIVVCRMTEPGNRPVLAVRDRIARKPQHVGDIATTARL